MHKLKNITIYLFILFLISGNLLSQSGFVDRQDLGIIDDSRLTEISGIVASRINPDIFWVHNDSGDEARIYAVNRNCKLVAIYYLKGVTAIDWEDITIGPGPVDGIDYLYVGDIGDNDAVYPNRSIYRFPEPELNKQSQEVYSDTIQSVDKITYIYPDGARDAECLLIDPLTKDLYPISKREAKVNVYKLDYPQTTSEVITAKVYCQLLYGYEGFSSSGVTAGDISRDGREILIKTYSTVYYYQRKENETLLEALSATPQNPKYVFEPQGEAICWDATGSGFYTTSEIRFSAKPHLYFYPKTETSVKDKKKDEFFQEVISNPNFFWDFTFLSNLPNDTRCYVSDLSGNQFKIINYEDLNLNNLQNTLVSGIYYLTFISGNKVFSKKIVLF